MDTFELESLLNLQIFQNSPMDWSIALGIAMGVFFVLLTIRRLVRRKRARLAQTPETELIEVPLDVLSRTTLPFFVVLSVFLGLRTLTMGPTSERVLVSALTIALFWQAGVWISAAVTAWLERKRARALATDRAAAGSLGVVGFIAKVLVWSLVLLVTLDNLGVDVTALIAGLGIGGIAIALAAQNILGDLFASLSITFDRPFVLGDFLIVGDFLGSVEYIGIKSTRLRSLGGEQIIIANADLLGSRVRNYGRMAERRVAFSIGVIYETPIAALETIPGLIREAIEEQPLARFDRAHFARHAAASLDFDVVYYVTSPEYAKYMDTQQAINLKLHREFERRGISFAYPTQRLIVEQAAEVQAAA